MDGGTEEFCRDPIVGPRPKVCTIDQKWKTGCQRWHAGEARLRYHDANCTNAFATSSWWCSPRSYTTSLVQMKVYEQLQSILFLTYAFGNPHNLQLNNFVPNENFCPMGVKTGIPWKKKYDFSYVLIFMSLKIAFLLTIESSF